MTFLAQTNGGVEKLVVEVITLAIVLVQNFISRRNGKKLTAIHEEIASIKHPAISETVKSDSESQNQTQLKL